MRRAMLLGVAYLLISGAVCAGPRLVQETTQPRPQKIVELREVLAFAYPGDDDTVSVKFDGTERLPRASGEAKVERRKGFTEIEVEFDELRPAHNFGGDLNTYVLWVVSAEGNVDNVGEVILRGNRSKLNVTTPLQSFAMLVTAEPHALVRRPSKMVVLQNTRVVNEPDVKVTTSTVRYAGEVLEYHVERPTLSGTAEAATTVRTEADQARVAVDLARRAGAERFAPLEYQQARSALARTEAAVAEAGGRYKEKIAEQAQEAIRLAVAAQERAREEEARVAAAEEREQMEKAIRDAKTEAERRELEAQAEARAKEEAVRRAAEAEERTRAAQLEAERARLETERLRLEAEQRAKQPVVTDERLRIEIQTALESERQSRAAEIAALQEELRKATTEAERVRITEQQRQLDLQMEQKARETAEQRVAEANRRAEEEARARKEAEAEAERLRGEKADREAAAERARREAEEARNAAELARRDREEARRRLREALGEVVSIRETARGLIVSLPDVLFDFGKATLRPSGREKLSRLAGILATAQGFRLNIEGHTDSIGSETRNLSLSEQRARSVRQYLVGAGVSPEVLQTQGFGESQPVASNATAAGRQKNRRVEIVIADMETATPPVPAQPPQQ